MKYNEERERMFNTLVQWVVGILFLVILMLVFTSCGKRPIYKYESGVFMPETKDKKKDIDK
jgi:multisubunit Na+/H+ antiporter MnhB subunit